MSTHPFHGAPRKTPTLKHRPAIWECMLGTVYAQSPEGEVKYFDYKWDDARAFAGITADSDPRVSKTPPRRSLPQNASRRQMILWVLR